MRVAAALSGGVDSSVSAFLLKQAGYDVVGVSFFHRYLNTDASHIAEKLNIPYLRVDIDAAFKEYVVDYFIGEYLSGRTPNPCVWCNRRIKFGLFRQLALQLADAELFATGHYVSLLECGETRFLSKNEDPEYEQSYFLCYLTQDELAKTIFPLSTMNKKEVRRIAQE
ncbi:MAG: tRNA 2-thiouridine(34) synthase MnmA, partial [Planctomycetota bacterium]|nr:tRNA 2-thiouridine(34) synthase MnmA [Planctomycetota bacterium]